MGYVIEEQDFGFNDKSPQGFSEDPNNLIVAGSKCNEYSGGVSGSHDL